MHLLGRASLFDVKGVNRFTLKFNKEPSSSTKSFRIPGETQSMDEHQWMNTVPLPNWLDYWYDRKRFSELLGKENGEG